MYESNSIHYYSIGYPATSITKKGVRECIAYNKKGRDKRGLIWDGGFNCHGMEKLVSYVKDGHIKKVYYYYHTYNKELKSDEAKVFISYAELDDAINKDLESYKELLVSSPSPTQVVPSGLTGNTFEEGTKPREAERNATSMDGIAVGTIGVGTNGEQIYVDGAQGINIPEFTPQYGRYDGAVMPTATAARTQPYGIGIEQRQQQQEIGRQRHQREVEQRYQERERYLEQAGRLAAGAQNMQRPEPLQNAGIPADEEEIARPTLNF